jgi:hypothetical protein
VTSRISNSDEWNQFEITTDGDKAEFKCNGESLKKMSVKEVRSPLGVRARRPMDATALPVVRGARRMTVPEADATDPRARLPQANCVFTAIGA